MLAKWLIYRRLPWVRGIEARDCGAAVFASIAGYYQHHLSLEQARHLVSADRDGTSLSGLRDGGRAIGLDARPAHATYEALGQIHLPAIVHLHGTEGHYLVLYRWTPAALIVLDPNTGVRRMARAEFEAQWSGYVIEYVPTPLLAPRAPEFRPMHKLQQILWAHKGAVLLALVFALLAASLGWASSFFVGALIDRILPNRDTALLLALGLGLLLISVGQAVLQLGRLWLLARVGRTIHHDYGDHFIRHLLRLPMKIYDARCVAGLVLRVGQADMIQQALTEGTVGLLGDALMFLAALAVMAWFDPLAAVIAFGAVPLMIVVLLLLNDRVYGTQLMTFGRNDDFNAHMIDVFDGLRTVKTFGAEERYQTLLATKLDRVVDARYRSRIALALPTTWSMLATALVTSSILWYGSVRVMAGAITTGDLIVLFGMLAFYLNPVQRLPTTLLSIRTALIAMERIEEILALPPEDNGHEAQHTVPMLPVRGHIEFRDVRFGYKARRPVLRDISFTVEPGETVAIVGETGSGKTSLANLLAGFYLPDTGDVQIDGVSTRDMPLAQRRRAISAVFQDSRLFQQSLRANITMLADVPPSEVQRVAELANATPFIDELLRGYDTQVARGSSNFSSGQAQRIALARALLKDAPILILDEATSNLDGATEQGVLQAVENNRRGRTTVIIAHRLSTVLRADRIVVMDGGQIVEMGTHEELLAQRGQYYHLFRWQVEAGDQLPVPAYT